MIYSRLHFMIRKSETRLYIDDLYDNNIYWYKLDKLKRSGLNVIIFRSILQFKPFIQQCIEK